MKNPHLLNWHELAWLLQCSLISGGEHARLGCSVETRQRARSSEGEEAESAKESARAIMRVVVYSLNIEPVVVVARSF